MTSSKASLPEVIIADFAEVAKLHILGVCIHLPDYFLDHFHNIMVSLLPPLYKGIQAISKIQLAKYPDRKNKRRDEIAEAITHLPSLPEDKSYKKETV